MTGWGYDAEGRFRTDLATPCAPCPSPALDAAARRARAGAVASAALVARVMAYEQAQVMIEQALQEHTNARGYSTPVHDALKVVYAQLDAAILAAVEER